MEASPLNDIGMELEQPALIVSERGDDCCLLVIVLAMITPQSTTTATHVKVTREDGTLEFVSYDEKIVLECQANALEKNATLDSSNSNSDSDSSTNGSTNSTGETCSTTVAVGLYYNDVWEYNLNCTRYGEILMDATRCMLSVEWYRPLYLTVTGLQGRTDYQVAGRHSAVIHASKSVVLVLILPVLASCQILVMMAAYSTLSCCWRPAELTLASLDSCPNAVETTYVCCVRFISRLEPGAYLFFAENHKTSFRQLF